MSYINFDIFQQYLSSSCEIKSLYEIYFVTVFDLFNRLKYFYAMRLMMRNIFIFKILIFNNSQYIFLDTSFSDLFNQFVRHKCEEKNTSIFTLSF